MTYEITLQGCDASTVIEVPLYADQAVVIEDLVDRFAEASKSSCHPTMRIRELCAAPHPDAGRRCGNTMGHRLDHQVEYEDDEGQTVYLSWPRQP